MVRPMHELRTVFTAEVTLPLPPDEAWSALTRWEEAERWMGDVDDVRALGPNVAGTRVVFTARGKTRESEIAVAEAPTRLVLRSEQGAVVAEYRYDLTPVEGGTRVGLVAACHTGGLLRLLGPVIRGAIRKADQGQLDRLAAHVG